jgi:hypothetical protein
MKYEKKLKNLEELYLNQIENLNKKFYLSEKNNNYSSNNKEERSNGRFFNLGEDEDFREEVISLKVLLSMFDFLFNFFYAVYLTY